MMIIFIKKTFLRLVAQKIVWRTTIWIWGLMLFTILIFVLYTIPFQKETLIDRMENESVDIGNSILHANNSALITEDYGTVVDHCTQLVNDSRSILYVVVTRNDGYSIVHTKNKWYETRNDLSWLPDTTDNKGKIIWSNLIKGEVFQKSYKVSFSGVVWGWIHIGLSLDNYDKSLSKIEINITWLTMVMAVLGFVFSLLFAKKLTKPMRILDRTTKLIAGGNLSAKANINTGDELQSLAVSFNKMTDSLRIARDELELRVQERTSALAETNEIMVNEISERRKMEDSLQRYAFRLEGLQDIYRGIITAKTAKEIAFETISKLQTQIADFTEASLNLFDFASKTAVIHQFRQNGSHVEQESIEFPIPEFTEEDLHQPDLVICNNLEEKNNLQERESELLYSGIKSYLRSTLSFQGELIGELIFRSPNRDQFSQEDGSVVREISNQLSVAIASSKLQDNLRLHAQTLQTSLEEKDILLKEIHHRVKNNLQIISSLLFLQSCKIKDEENLSIFQESQNRIKSMALVHEKLYQSKELSRINFSEYINNLAQFIYQTYKNQSANIEFDYQLDDVFMSIDDAVPLGLILNELLTNSIKYAFRHLKPESEQKKIIQIRLKKDFDQLLFEVSDNGIGLPKDFDIQKSESLGLKLVNNLTQQVRGELTTSTNSGAVFTILMKHNFGG
ncbi:MAG: ATP-binding protein [Ignavibacteriales bacterium]|nr:ATP-binding protein [Ignavibacteriales bacterium]